MNSYVGKLECVGPTYWSNPALLFQGLFFPSHWRRGGGGLKGRLDDALLQGRNRKVKKKEETDSLSPNTFFKRWSSKLRHKIAKTRAKEEETVATPSLPLAENLDN